MQPARDFPWNEHQGKDDQAWKQRRVADPHCTEQARGRLACQEHQKIAVSFLGRYDSLSFAFMEVHENKKQLRVAVPSPVSFPALDSGTPLVAHPRPPHLPTCHAFPHDAQGICYEHGNVRVSS